MDSYRSRQYSHPTRSPLNHPSSVSPGSQASPHTTMKGGNQNSPLMPTFGRSYSTSQGLDRILQSPHDAYGRSSLPNQDGYGRSSVNDESSRGYGDAEYGSGGIQQGYSTSGHGGGDGHGGQAGGANFTTSGPTAKRGSKACVACEYNRRLFLRHVEGRARSKRKESVSRRPFRFEPVVPEMPDERYSMRLREGDGEDRTGEKWERWR